MPVLKASGEAEGLCAQLNKEGHVDACITSDSDAFLFGAKCIIKNLKPNSKVMPFWSNWLTNIVICQTDSLKINYNSNPTILKRKKINF